MAEQQRCGLRPHETVLMLFRQCRWQADGMRHRPGGRGGAAWEPGQTGLAGGGGLVGWWAVFRDLQVAYQ